MPEALIHPHEEAIIYATREPFITLSKGASYSGCVFKLDGGRSQLLSLSFSPNGQHFCASTDDGFICVWDYYVCANTHYNDTDMHTAAIACIAFSPDGQLVYSGSDDNTIRIWDTSSGLQTMPALLGHSESVLALTCSPDGMQLASASMGTMILWNLTSGTPKFPPFHHKWKSYLTAFDFSPDSTRIASRSNNYTVRVWDVKSGKKVLSLLRHDHEVVSVKFLHDGTQIASGGTSPSDQGFIHLWDADSGLKTRRISLGQWNSGMSLCSSLDGAHISAASTSRDNEQRTRVWSVSSGNELPSLHYWQDVGPPKEVNILKNDWITNHDATLSYSRLPNWSLLAINSLKTRGTSLAVGTDDGLVVIMHLPLRQ